jgi:RNA polymerase-binding transcription factor DksA
MGSADRVQRRAERRPTPAGTMRLAMRNRKASVAVPVLLTPLQRLQLRDRLQQLWRTQVEIISTAGVRSQLMLDRGSDSSRVSVEGCLATARARITDFEAAIRRMDARHYGTCEQCFQPMTFDELIVTPEKTTCAGCESAVGESRRGAPKSGVGHESHPEDE